MQKKKSFKYLLITIVFMMCFTACSTNASMSFTFGVETGDFIKVSLNTKGKYSLKQEDGHFIVLNDGEQILEGLFIMEDTYESYLEAARELTVFEDSEKDGNPYVYYEYSDDNGVQNNFVLFVKGSNTGILIGSIAEKDAAKEAFDRLTFSKDDEK